MFLDTTDGVALIDLDGTVQKVNDKFRAFMGIGEGQNLPPEATALKAGQTKITRRVGEKRLVLLISHLPVPGSGAILRVSDHTHEQDLEDQLAQAQRLQAVGELAGGIAHDFNNLLTAILGAADDLRARAEDGAADARDIDLVRQSALRGAGLVRHLLAFSRQQTLQPRVLALNEAVRATTTLLQRLLSGGVHLEINLEEPGRQVRIDPTQFDQVLINLAVNASHAMPNGGTLRISTGHDLKLAPELFGGETVPPGRYARLSVEDTGTGIPPEILPRIFEPFFTTRRGAGGTGLGLSTVHGIVRQSGGYMAVHSKQGEGTRFDILFPRHEDAAAWQPAPAAPAPVVPAPRPTTSRTLLLVDDEAPVRQLAERVLIRAGWRVVAAACAEDALELVDAGDLAPALACVVSDVVMPGMDGPALVRALRLEHPGLPAILMSGYADAGLRQSLQDADIQFLHKPFAMADLTAVLARQAA